MARMSRLTRGILATLVPVTLGVIGVGAFPASAGVHPLTSVSGVTVSISSPSSAAGAVTTYNVGFTTSASGALSGNAGDTITVTLPSGSNLSTLANSAVTVAGNQVGACGEASTTVAICDIFGGDTVPASTAVAVALGGVTNPATVGSYKLTVATSKDTTAVSSPSYTVTAAGKVTGLAVAVSPTLAAGALTTYTESFTTSSTGGLAQEAGSSITVTFPSGTSLSTLVNSAVTVAGNEVGDCGETSTTVATCSFFGGETVAANTAVTVVLGGVTNPAATGSYKLSLVTSSDTTSVSSPSYAVTAAQGVGGLSVAVSPTLAAGALTTYTESFTTSSTGGLAQEAGSTITVTFPSGTNLSTLVNSAVTVAGNEVGDCGETATTVATCSFFGGDSVAAGTAVTVVLGGVTNPVATGSYALKVATSSDTTSVTSPSYAVTAAQGVGGLSVSVAPSAAAGALTTYTESFTTSSTGGLAQEAGSTITVTFPSGTTLSTLVNSAVTVAGNEVGDCGETATTVATCSFFGGETVAAGTAVTVVLGGVTNPAATGSYTLGLATSSDTTSVTSPSYTVTAVGKVTAPKVTLSNALTGATNVTYTTQFKTDTGMSQTSGSEIKMTFPAGTKLSGLTNTEVTVSGNEVGDCSAPSNTQVFCSFFSGETVPGGSTVVVTLAGVTNPSTTSAYPLKLSTTSDTKIVTTHYCVAGASVPCISKLAPGTGAVGTAVTITGINLSGATAVDFNGTAATITSDTAKKIVTAVPAGATTGTVTVTTPHGTATSPTTFTVT